MEVLLDFGKPFNPNMLDQAIRILYNPSPQEVASHSAINGILVRFQEHPEAWKRVVQIYGECKNPHAQLFGLSILIKTVKTQWNVLPASEQRGIKDYVMKQLITLSQDPKKLIELKAIIGKFNLILVEIVKHDWPERWPTFITDICNSSKVSQYLCANNMNILLLLSEEVFDFASESMTQKKMVAMKKHLNSEFKQIYTLFMYIFDAGADLNLLLTTLRTLLRFLAWIPAGYIFETNLIDLLVNKFLPNVHFQNDALKCLAEIASIDLPHNKHDKKLEQMFVTVVAKLTPLLTPTTDMAKVYATGEQTVQTFVNYLALFLTGFLKAHLSLVEKAADEQTRQSLRAALEFLLRISVIESTKIFKMCLEYWNILVVDLYHANRIPTRRPLMLGESSQQSPRVQNYRAILSQLRRVMISKMAKPEEVLIIVDTAGEVIREPVKDGAAIVLYKDMRDCLIYLTHLDPTDAQTCLLGKLAKQVHGSEFSWHNLNKLCWAIGSIAGSLGDALEKSFLVRVIRDLLHLCEQKSGKEHKAVIASNIMYVVGQYPSFLRQHWRFLKTVVNKLFEFMHEKHPGVQDMSCETFLKIARHCRKKFVVRQPDEKSPFIEEILTNLATTIRDLEQSQVHLFYEAVGVILAAQSNAGERQKLVSALMSFPNQMWTQVLQQTSINRETLYDPKTIKQVINVLKANCRVAKSLKSHYMVQLGRIYDEMLVIYNHYSSYVSAKITSAGVQVCDTTVIRLMRAVKKETLKLIEQFVRNCKDKDLVMRLLPKLKDSVLVDYQRNVPAARDEEVLTLFATIITSLENKSISVALPIFDHTFQCTLEMIKNNYLDYPDHRLPFYTLLRAINQHSFPALLQLAKIDASKLGTFVHSIRWAFSHLEKNVAEIGLTILTEFLRNVDGSEMAGSFYKQFYKFLVQELLKVLTDTMHKPGFGHQATILARLFALVESGKLTVPLFDRQGQFPNNSVYIRTFVGTMLAGAFKNLTKPQVISVVQSMFKSCNDATLFKQNFRDFLVQLKEFSQDDELYKEERNSQIEQAKLQQKQQEQAVPGLAYSGPSADQLSQQRAAQMALNQRVHQVLGQR